MGKATRENVIRVREIALKFFRGNGIENRQGYKEAGLLDELDALCDYIADSLAEEDTMDAPSPQTGD
jgi:hypothetical protein